MESSAGVRRISCVAIGLDEDVNPPQALTLATSHTNRRTVFRYMGPTDGRGEVNAAPKHVAGAFSDWHASDPTGRPCTRGSRPCDGRRDQALSPCADHRDVLSGRKQRPVEHDRQVQA